MKIDKDSIAVISVDANKVASVTTLSGKDVTSEIKDSVLSAAVDAGEEFFWYNALPQRNGWQRQSRNISGIGINAAQRKEILSFISGEGKPTAKKEVSVESVPEVEVPKEVLAFKEFVHNSVEIRPELLKMPDLKWKYLVRSVLKGKNIMMTGPAGSGKTFAVQQLTKALNGKAKVVKKVVSREELEAMKQNMKIEIDTYKKV